MRRMCSRTSCCRHKIGENYGRIRAVGDAMYVDKLQLGWGCTLEGTAAQRIERPERCSASSLCLCILNFTWRTCAFSALAILIILNSSVDEC